MLAPKSLDLGQIQICFIRGRDGCLDPCVFASSQQPSRESAARIRSPMMHTHRRNMFFMHGNIVEITEPVLQTLERSKKSLASFDHPLIRKEAGEEFRRVTQLLGLDAQFVVAARIELREGFAFLTHFTPPSG